MQMTQKYTTRRGKKNPSSEIKMTNRIENNNRSIQCMCMMSDR